MKFFLKSFLLLFPLLACLLTMDSCHKELFTTKGALSFSNDTLTFDTVFTSLGSVTKPFTIRNTQSKAINISSIKLLGLSGSQFRININGISGTQFSNVVIPAHDSIYGFAEVTVNPNISTNPFVLYDDIQFVTNGNTQNMILEAMGQNAYYYFSYQVVRGTTFTMPTDKPNIIINKNGGLPIFSVDTGATLNIPPGCQIYMAPGAVMTVDGTLNAHGGSWSDSIVFQYIRRDYPGQPGLWLGITTSRLAKVSMDHVIIDQSTFGLSDEYVLDLLAQAQITTSNVLTYASDHVPVDSLSDVIIRNSSSASITALHSTFYANNCLFFSCGGSMATIGMGGNYTITNCTLANCFSNTQTSQGQILTITDQLYPATFLNSSVLLGPYATTVTMTNTIVAGNTATNELQFAFGSPSSDHISFSYDFLTERSDSLAAYSITNSNGIDTAIDPQLTLYPPLFALPYSNNYAPDSGSIIVSAGNATIPDLYNNNRPSHPSIGAIQWLP